MHPVNKINCLIQLAWNNSLSRLLPCYNENENKCLIVLFVEDGCPSALINKRFKTKYGYAQNDLATLTKETAFNEARTCFSYFSFHLFIYLFGWLGALEAKGNQFFQEFQRTNLDPVHTSPKRVKTALECRQTPRVHMVPDRSCVKTSP